MDGFVIAGHIKSYSGGVGKKERSYFEGE